MSTDHPYCPPEVVEVAAGSVEAQRLADGIAEGRLQAAHAWLMFLELQARHGKNSPACMSFVIGLAKRVAR